MHSRRTRTEVEREEGASSFCGRIPSIWHEAFGIGHWFWRRGSYMAGFKAWAPSMSFTLCLAFAKELVTNQILMVIRNYNFIIPCVCTCNMCFKARAATARADWRADLRPTRRSS